MKDGFSLLQAEFASPRSGRGDLIFRSDCFVAIASRKFASLFFSYSKIDFLPYLFPAWDTIIRLNHRRFVLD